MLNFQEAGKGGEVAGGFRVTEFQEKKKKLLQRVHGPPQNRHEIHLSVYAGQFATSLPHAHSGASARWRHSNSGYQCTHLFPSFLYVHMISRVHMLNTCQWDSVNNSYSWVIGSVDPQQSGTWVEVRSRHFVVKCSGLNDSMSCSLCVPSFLFFSDFPFWKP